MNNRTEFPRISSDRISKLDENEIFVFGSNLEGMHRGGAARIAYEQFGAIWGAGVGMNGQSYAIPTMQGSIETIKPYICQFIDFAKHSPHLKFLVTRTGCGIAGFTDADIAPLFTEALQLDNVYLPKSFYDKLVSLPKVPDFVLKKIYGQTRTLVDILIALNNKKHFKSSNEAIDAVSTYLQGLREHGNEIASNCSIHSLRACADNCFANGHLDVKKLKKSLEKGFYNDNLADKAYMNYVIEKTIKLIMYMNEFRRYTDVEQIINDFQQATGEVNHCQEHSYYFEFGSYPSCFFRNYIQNFWHKFAPNGELNNELFYDFMIDRHTRGIKKYGLEAVINRNYQNDGPCHPEVFFPYRGGVGPVYVERETNPNLCGRKPNRRFIKSCGEGKGPNAVTDYFEFNLVKRLIENDPKYVVLKDFKNRIMLVPKNDVTLPVYDYYYGKEEYDSLKTQEAAIKKIWEAKH